MSIMRLVFAGLFFLWAAVAAAQVQTAHYNTSIAGHSLGFYDYLPQGYETGTEKYPLIVYLHGAGQRGNGDSVQLPLVLQGLAKVIQDGRFPTSFTVNGQTHRFIVITPQFTIWPYPALIDQVIAYAIRTYRVNQQRIYLAGYSMGGGVTWDYASYCSSFANRLAAIVPVAGSSFASTERGRVIAAANLPVWALHNNGDPTVSVTKTENYIAAVNAAPGPVPAAKKTIFFSKEHDAWTKAFDPLYKEGGLNVYEWMLQYQRNTLVAGSSSPVCQGGTLTLWALPVDGATYRWTGPNGFTSTSRAPAIANVSAVAAGTYTVTLTKGDSTATASTKVVFQNTQVFYRDADRDNYGTAQTLSACRAPDGYVTATGDCNDADKNLNPGAPELCDGIDNDCNGVVDDNPAQILFYKDADKDGYGNDTAKVTACLKPSGYVTIGGDCNDANKTVYPNAPELCDGLDNDCNGIKDDNLSTRTFYKDFDKDGYGNLYAKTLACTMPAGYVTNSLDCKDADATIYPGAPELCDGLDNDCDGVIDDGLVLKAFYYDGDKDGYGSSTKKSACAAPPGYVSLGGDCNDKAATINPGAAEIAGNGIDDNCNGKIDEAPTTLKRSGAANPVIAETFQLIIAPNPARQPVTVSIRSHRNEPVQLRVYNATGRLVESRTALPNTSIRLYKAGAAGMYYVEAVQGRQQARQRLLCLPH